MPTPLAMLLLMLCCDQPAETTPKTPPTMTEWHKNIVAFHTIDDAADLDSLVLGTPATTTSIRKFERAIGYSMPDEFKELYSEFDGYGTTRNGEVEWFFLPLAKLTDHASVVRHWFQKTHPEIAKRFVPFVDWADGDASGYFFSESGIAEPGIFDFDHESCEFKKTQDWREFLFPVHTSIRDLLTD